MTATSNPNPYPELIFFKPLYFILLFIMAVSGFGQMPIFKRYYIADIPGLAWLADFYFTHYIHYIGAIVLFAFFVYAAVVYFGLIRRRFRLSWAAYIRIALLALITATGIFRVLKNLPDVVFPPLFTMVIDISHLAFMMLLALFGLGFILLKKNWLVQKI
jgi:heme A synthase